MSIPNFKVLDNDWSADQVNHPSSNQYVAPEQRQSMGQMEYHNYPANVYNTPQFQHMMKRTGDTHKLSEIFGSNQDYSRMNQIDAHVSSGARLPQEVDEQNLEMDIKDRIYGAISDYFSGCILTKIKMFGKYAVYKAVIQCLLCDGTRFIVAIVPGDNNELGNRSPLENLKWEAFQTRFQQDDSEVKQFGISSFSYFRPTKTILNDKIRLHRQNSGSNIYQCDTLPLQVEILRQNKDEYIAETGTIAGALDLFNTVVWFN